MAVLDIGLGDITALAQTLKAQVSDSIVANADWVRANAARICIVSNGFVEFIAPVVAELGIAEDRVVANRFLLDTDDRIIGADPAVVDGACMSLPTSAKRGSEQPDSVLAARIQ